MGQQLRPSAQIFPLLPMPDKQTVKQELIVRDELMAYACMAPVDAATKKLFGAAAGSAPSSHLPGIKMRGNIYRITIEFLGVDARIEPQLYDYLSYDARRMSREAAEAELAYTKKQRSPWRKSRKEFLNRVIEGHKAAEQAYAAAMEWRKHQPKISWSRSAGVV